jgi:hypothetical protein
MTTIYRKGKIEVSSKTLVNNNLALFKMLMVSDGWTKFNGSQPSSPQQQPTDSGFSSRANIDDNMRFVDGGFSDDDS